MNDDLTGGHVRHLGRDWRRLPRLGRINTKVEDGVAGKVTIYDSRAAPCVAQFPGWGRRREALRLSVRIVEVTPAGLYDFEFPVLVASLHALERRYSRADV